MAADLIKEDRPPHLVWHPATGEIVQLLPVTRAARLLGDRIGHEGRVCVQIMVIGQSRAPFTGALLAGLDAIVQWLDSWGVARRWPAGPPLPSPQSYHSRRSRRDWAHGGHYGASQVPLAERPDPGGIDIRRITGPDTPVAPIPRPRAPLGDAGPPRRVSRGGRTAEPVLPAQNEPARPRPPSEPVRVGSRSAMSN
ncbi:hypothetical protein [Actinomadura chibensis]|uniref:hypothetical protein n=1 Tax=Actinomadura chibensis TaxID=392828 RepID=UPI00157C7A55|nr:hypothetical protein [Actinomadura chibensis]